MFFSKRPVPIETINDVDGNIVNLFRVCRESPQEFTRLLELTPWSREEFLACADLNVPDPLERARRTVVRYHQSFATCNHSKNSWRNVQKSNGPRCSSSWNSLPEEVEKTCKRLKDAQIENIDALELIRRYDDPNTLLYLDPPYPLNIREKNLYKHEMTDARHEELLQLILTSKSKIVISSYDNELYNDALKDWYTTQKSTIVQQGLHRTEKLYMNYQPPLLAL